MYFLEKNCLSELFNVEGDGIEQLSFRLEGKHIDKIGPKMKQATRTLYEKVLMEHRCQSSPVIWLLRASGAILGLRIGFKVEISVALEAR